ncbi:MAG: GatB/YqeY domain-containing protein [Firmicutes bacterium]|nr:GatB/YqeY domain-containing protein [Bacillota bacterium]
MSLEERLIEDQLQATRAKDRFSLNVIRVLRAELKNASIAKKGPLETDEELAVLTREIKRRQEALKDYERAGRPELLEELQREIALLQRYLPPQLSEAELEELVEQALRETGAASKRDLGKVMGWLMPRVKGRADGSLVRRLVESKLQ